MYELISLKLKCPVCGKSLMDEEHLVDNQPSISLNVEIAGKTSKINLSSIYGSYNYVTDIEMPKGEIAKFICPHCETHITSDSECMSCGANMVPFHLDMGGKVTICSRSGCKNHIVAFEDLSIALKKMYQEYGLAGKDTFKPDHEITAPEEKPVDEKLVSILREFFDTLIQTEFTPELRRMVLDCYQPGRTLGEASRCLAGRIFEGLDVELFDPSNEEFVDFSRDILLREADHTPEGAQCNLFYMDGRRRMALFRKDGRFVNRKGETVDLSAFPLVPSLKTRNICQDAWFGTEGYIAGPGEVKYLGDMGENYRFHGVKAAVVIPRMSIDLIEPPVKRNLGKLGLDISRIDTLSLEEMVKRKVEEVSGFNREEITVQTQFLVSELVTGLNRLGLEGNKLKKKVEKEIREQIGLKRKAMKERSGSVIRQIETVYLHLRPGGVRQERVFNIYYYMNLYGGRDLVRFLYSNYDQKLKFLELNHG